MPLLATLLTDTIYVRKQNRVVWAHRFNWKLLFRLLSISLNGHSYRTTKPRSVWSRFTQI